MQTTTVTKTLSFYKESGIWYADLPAFLEAGLGTKSNLMINHQLWLCPVTEYVFEGGYPDKIFIKKIK